MSSSRKEGFGPLNNPWSGGKKVGAKIREQDYSFDSMVTAQIYQKYLPLGSDFFDDLLS